MHCVVDQTDSDERTEKRSGEASTKPFTFRWLVFNPSKAREGFWMPLRSVAVSRILGHGFPPSLNRAVENTSTLLTHIDSNES